MANSRAGGLLEHVRALVDEREARSDAELLDQFIWHGDEQAFAAILRRHAPLVLGVCRRTLQHEQDAEDVFQATFLVLARRAGAVRRRSSLRSWLYGVAYRLAVKARVQAARRSLREKHISPPNVTTEQTDVTWRELRQVLDEELARLPEKLRAPLLLCYFDGRTQDEASHELRSKARTIKARLARGRALLRRRLEKRGLTLSAVLAGPLLGTDGLPHRIELCRATARAAKLYAAKELWGEVVSARVLALAEGGLREMLLTKLSGFVLALSALIFLGIGTGLVVGRARQTAAIPDPVQETGKTWLTDLSGDPLPLGAVARLGTTRFRVGGRLLGFLSDNQTLVACGREAIQFWDAQTGKLLREVDTKPMALHGNSVLSRDGKFLAAGAGLPDAGNRPTPGAVGIWQIPGGKLVRKLERTYHDAVNCSLAFTPDGKLLVSIGGEGVLRIEEVQTGLEILRHQFPRDSLPSLAISPDGEKIAVNPGANRDKLFLWNWQTGAEPQELKHRNRVGRFLTFAPDSKTLVECREYGERGGRVWDVGTGRLLQEFAPTEPANYSIRDFVFLDDGKTCLTSSYGNHGDGTTYFWDKATMQPIRRLADQGISVHSPHISPDGRLLAGVSVAQLRIWDLKADKELTNPDSGHQGSPSLMAVTRTGLIVTAGDDFSIRVWDSATTKQRLRMTHGHWIRSIAVSPDGARLVSSSLDDSVCVWDLLTGEKIFELPGHGRMGGHRAVAFTNDGRHFLSWGDDMYLRKWEVATGKAVLEHRLSPSGFSVSDESDLSQRMMKSDLGCAGFSTDGSLFVVNMDDQYHIFDVATGKEAGTIANEGSFVISMVISPDSTMLLASALGKPVKTQLEDGRMRYSSSKNNPVCLWDLASGKLIKQIVLEGEMIGPVAFSADSKMIAAAVSDPEWRVSLWSIDDEKEMGVIKGFRGAVRSLAFLPDGKRLASGMDDTTALVWNLTEILTRRNRQ